MDTAPSAAEEALGPGAVVDLGAVAAAEAGGGKGSTVTRSSSGPVS